MINLEDIEKQIEELDNEIIKLNRIKRNLQQIVDFERNDIYEEYIPIINKYLDKELNKEDQNKLWLDLKKHKIKDVLLHLQDKYNHKYIKSEDENWLQLLITKKGELI